MTARVVCVGGAVLDLVYTVDRLPGEDGKTHALGYFETGGGMAANAAVAVARLGGSASWWGRVGDDDKGVRILQGLRDEDVGLDDARVVEGAVSSHSVVLADAAGNRAIVLYRSTSLDPGIGFLPVAKLSSFDAVLADNRWIEGAVAVLTQARDIGLPGVLDADAGTGPRTIEAVRCASHVIFSQTGLTEIYGTPDVDGALRLAVANVPFAAATLGERGVSWLTAQGDKGWMPAFAVAPVETVGAGDVFHGAFALALGEGRSEIDAMRFAAAAAALKCAGGGGRRSFPDRASVDRLAGVG